MAVSLDQFTTQLLESGAISDQDLRAYLDQLPPSDKPGDGEQLAKRLVKDKKISAYQAQVVYSGKGKTLTMGSYFVLEKLGQGGMGMVLKAQHRMMKRLVAIKVLSPSVTKTSELKQRFQREVEAAARLTHPNVVGAFDAGESNGSPFLVMEYVPGDDLSSIVKKNGPLSVDQAIDCIIQAARGLEFAHSQGVIHRDIKPANLLMDSKGAIKILDMGLARIDSADVATQANLTGTGTVMGTVDYMAPEQALSTKNADARSDLYSLGISLWYLLTGKSAYEGDSLMERLLAHRERPIPSLRDERDDVSESLEVVFRKLVAKKQADRYQTATELIADLEACRTGASIKAVAFADRETGWDEFQNSLHSADSSRENARSRKSNPQMTATKSHLQVTSPSETMPTFDDTDTFRTRRKKAKKNKQKPWFQDPRVLIGGGATIGLLALALLFIPRRNSQVPTEKTNTETNVAASTSGIDAKPDKSENAKATPSTAATSSPAIASSPTVDPPKPPQNSKTVFLNAGEAGPDYEIQGEYFGNLAGTQFGVQVIAKGNGRFDAVVFLDGLPGLGWDHGKKIKHFLTGETINGTTQLTGNGFDAVIVPGTLTLKLAANSVDLKKLIRQSPTMGLRPPQGAIVLFDGKNVDHWNPGIMEEGNLMGVGTRTKQVFEDFTLHIEFRIPFMPTLGAQARGNSGLYLGDQYELQILDSFGLEGLDNECGGIYKNAKPQVNMCLPPLTWQTYDIDFTCAKFDTDGKVTAPARTTIKHNGILIHNDQALEPTPGGGRTDQKPGMLYIQEHGDPVRFQNIWLVPKK